MKIIYFDNLEYGGYGDFVTCHHCDNNNFNADAMLVPCGTEFCPLCGDPTVWKDEDNGNYELELDKAFAEHEIIHMNANYAEEYDDMADEAILIPLNKKNNE